MEVALIETGKMGQPMVHRLPAAGHALGVHKRFSESTVQLSSEGARGVGDDDMAALVRLSEEPASTTLAGSRPED